MENSKVDETECNSVLTKVDTMVVKWVRLLVNCLVGTKANLSVALMDS